MRTALLLLVVLLAVAPAQADWWDNANDKIANAFTSLGEWWRGEAAPTIREKFDEAKATAKDPEFHKRYMTWIKEKAVAAKEFAEAEVVPHLKDIYRAGKSAITDIQKEDGVKVDETP
ncbi:unnamed protein product, partial [Mesorhabditis spiculigera]